MSGDLLAAFVGLHSSVLQHWLQYVDGRFMWIHSSSQSFLTANSIPGPAPRYIAGIILSLKASKVE